MESLDCHPLTPDRLPDYLKFFEERAFPDNPRWDGCYCFFPLHDPELTDWHKRTSPENRLAVIQHVEADKARGYLAYLDGEAAGWCSAGPLEQYPMLRDQPEPDSATLGIVFCFVVAPELRGRGIAKALLRAACDGLQASGMTAVQAMPTKNANGAAENHFGPLAMYLKAGFAIVRETEDGNIIVRKELVEA